MLSRAICLCIFLLTLQLCSAQYGQHFNIWYFGNHAGLDFNTTPPTPLEDGQTMHREGTAVWCDSTGQLVLYTDGISAWNSKHQLIEGANALGGDSSTYQTLIVPVPGKADNYYIFSARVYVSKEKRGLYYSQIDMSKNNGRGALIRRKRIARDDGVAEGMTLIRDCQNNRSRFLFCDKHNKLHVWRIDGSAPVEDSVFQLSSKAGESSFSYVHCLKYNKKRKLLLLLRYNVELYHIDLDRKKLRFLYSLPDSEIQYPLGAEFSPNGKYVYWLYTFYVKNDDPHLPAISPVFQADISGKSISDVYNSIQTIYVDTNQLKNRGDSRVLYQMQLGPDNRIYVTNNLSNHLSVINAPDLPGKACDYSVQTVSLGKGISRLGLPNLYPFPESKPFHKPKLFLKQDIDPCLNSGTITLGIENYDGVFPMEFEWSLDGQKLADKSRKINIRKSGGQYCLHIWFLDPCYPEDTVFRDLICVDIDFPDILHLDLEQSPKPSCDTMLEALTLSAKGGYPPYQYALDGGPFSPLNRFMGLKPNTSYLFVVQDANGCTDSLRFFVATPSPPILLDIHTEPDYCDLHTGKVRVVAQGNGSLHYSLDGMKFSSNAQFDSLTKGEHRIWIKDSLNCTAQIRFVIRSSTLKDFLEPFTFLDTCSAAVGRIYVHNTGSLPFVCSINGSLYTADSVFEHLSAGQYHISMKDDLGCTYDTSVNVMSSPPLEISGLIIGKPSCATGSSMLRINYEGGSPPVYISLDQGAFSQDFEYDKIVWGKHHFTLIDTLGCRADTTIDLRADDSQCDVYIPNIFTPNGDLGNDIFQVYTRPEFDGEIVTFNIYDRWGDLFYSKDFHSTKAPSWDGKFRGKDVPPGVYVYFIQIQLGSETKQFYGDITLLR